MFTKIFTEPNALNAVIDQLITKLSGEETGTKEYAILVDQLTKLYKLKEIDTNLELKIIESDDKQRTNEVQSEIAELEIEIARKGLKIPFGIKPETLALIAANLAGIALIIGHERFNVVTTKAIGFVKQLKN